VSWVKDGILYDLMERDLGIEKGEFLGMAGEIISADAN
jgi:hypothetical protein